MARGEALTCVIVILLGPAMVWFFAQALWRARTSGTIVGGSRYAPRAVERSREPGLFAGAVAAHIVCLVTTAIITVVNVAKLLRWLGWA